MIKIIAKTPNLATSKHSNLLSLSRRMFQSKIPTKNLHTLITTKVVRTCVVWLKLKLVLVAEKQRLQVGSIVLAEIVCHPHFFLNVKNQTSLEKIQILSLKMPIKLL